MSVDDRLREAFGETDRSWDEQVPEALAAVTARRPPESAVRRGAAAALVAAAAVARRGDGVPATATSPADRHRTRLATHEDRPASPNGPSTAPGLSETDHDRGRAAGRPAPPGRPDAARRC